MSNISLFNNSALILLLNDSTYPFSHGLPDVIYVVVPSRPKNSHTLFAMNLLPLSERMYSGIPFHINTSLKHSITCFNVILLATLDDKTLIEYAKKTKKVITVEEHSVIGGLGSAVSECLIEKYPVQLKRIGINDIFGESGLYDELLQKHGLNSSSIIKEVNILLNEK